MNKEDRPKLSAGRIAELNDLMDTFIGMEDFQVTFDDFNYYGERLVKGYYQKSDLQAVMFMDSVNNRVSFTKNYWIKITSENGESKMSIGSTYYEVTLSRMGTGLKEI